LEADAREVIEERPVRIMVEGRPVATLMQTPGAEVELALGFVLTEGIVRSREEIGAISFCQEGSIGQAGEVAVLLTETASPHGRHRYRDVMSSCSLCGDLWLERIAEGLAPFDRPDHRISAAHVYRMCEIMSGQQVLFHRTGASHSAVIAQPPVEVPESRAAAREDVGRHNALDKAVGAALSMGLDLEQSLVLLSSRLSVEMVLKAARAGIADVAGVSAPSAAAIRLARRLEMFLAGFVRDRSMTVYSGSAALTVPVEDQQ